MLLVFCSSILFVVTLFLGEYEIEDISLKEVAIKEEQSIL